MRWNDLSDWPFAPDHLNCSKQQRISRQYRCFPLFFSFGNRKKPRVSAGKRFRPLIIFRENSKNSETAMPRMTLAVSECV